MHKTIIPLHIDVNILAILVPVLDFGYQTLNFSPPIAHSRQAKNESPQKHPIFSNSSCFFAQAARALTFCIGKKVSKNPRKI